MAAEEKLIFDKLQKGAIAICYLKKFVQLRIIIDKIPLTVILKANSKASSRLGTSNE